MLADTTKDAIRAAYARLKDGLPGFRARASQGRMIAEVAKAFGQTGGVAVIEAPTGTGKSMAYLIAGVEVARAQKKKLLIATATVALQEQLVERDIPLYLQVSGHAAKVALAKGRGRYLCPRNLAMARNSLAGSAQLGFGFDADLALWSKPPAERDKQALSKLARAFDEGQWNGDMDAAPEPVGELLRPMLTALALPWHSHRASVSVYVDIPVVEVMREQVLLRLLVSTFATALPLGLLLALGRRSRLPVVRLLCAAFVEGLRSVPLLALLFIAATLLPMFLPPGWNIGLFTRALVAFALFNAAMAAEVFRGGLQTVGAGQREAAATVGLTDLQALHLVVLPQALSAVVPALVNILIAVVKETTLLAVIGLNDVLGAIENGAKSPEWIGDANILTSGQVFLAVLYLAVCWGLSRYSRRLESRR